MIIRLTLRSSVSTESPERAYSQRLGIFRNSLRVFNDGSHMEKCCRGFVKRILKSVGIFGWPCVLWTALLSSRGYHLETGRMPLHDAVAINRKNGATTENHAAGVKYMD